jgi:hypothetical protein
MRCRGGRWSDLLRGRFNVSRENASAALAAIDPSQLFVDGGAFFQIGIGEPHSTAFTEEYLHSALTTNRLQSQFQRNLD